MNQRKLIPLFGLLVVLAGALLTVVQRFDVTTDLGFFLPPGRSTVDKMLLNQMDRGSTSNLIFAAVKGADKDRLAAVNQQLFESLKDSPHFSRVLNGSESVLAGEQEQIIRYRYLLTPSNLSHRLSTEGLRVALEERIRGLASASAPIEKRFLARDPTGEAFALLALWNNAREGISGPDFHNGVWFSQDHNRSLLIFELATSGFDLQENGEAVAAINANFDQLSDGDTNLELVLTGPSVFAVETRDVIRSDVRMLSLVATVLVAGFLLAAFRSAVLLAYVFLPLILGVVAAIASVLLIFGSIHGITLAFGITLIGVAVDYPIHLFAQLDGERERVRQHANSIWPTLRLGVVTTVMAYGALAVSEFQGLRQLGIFTITGLLTAAAVTHWLIPEIIPRRLPVSSGLDRVHAALERLGRSLSQAKMLLPLVVIVAVSFMMLSGRPLMDLDVDSLSPINEKRRTEGRTMREDLGFWSGGRMLIVVGPSAESTLLFSEALSDDLEVWREQGAIAGYETISQFLPSVKAQGTRQASIPADEELRQRFSDAANDLPLKQALFEPFFDEMASTRNMEPLTLDSFKGSLIGKRLSLLLFPYEDFWVAPILLHGVKNPGLIEQRTGEFGLNELVYLDLKKESTRILSDAVDRVVRLLAGAGVAIYVVLALVFGGWIKPLRILVPTIAAVLVVAASLLALNISLSLFHLVSLLLVIGLGLDYSLFFDRIPHNEAEWRTTFKALWVCCVTTATVFGLLVISHTPPLQGIGVTVALGAGLCLVLGASWSAGTFRHPWRRRRISAVRTDT